MWNGLKAFLLVWKKHYFIENLTFLINNLFGNVFLISGVLDLITLLYPMLKKYFNSGEKYFPAFQNFHIICMCLCT